MKNTVRPWLLCLVLASSPLAHASVWQAESSWSDEAEAQYADWVRAHWNLHFFEESNPEYGGLKVDCADAGYSMRAVYSYEHRMPFAIKDPTGPGVISQKMTRWDGLAPGARFHEFLMYVLNVGDAATLITNDSIPIAVNPHTVHSGGLIMTLSSTTHHTYTIQDVSPEGVPHLIYGSTPPSTKLFETFAVPNEAFLFPNGEEARPPSGFRYWRHPEDIGKPAWRVPGYSEEQYSVPLRHWGEVMQSKLAIRPEQPDQHIWRLVNETCIGARERANIIKDTRKFIDEKAPHRCLTSEEFDDNSTPTRDMRLRYSFEDLQDAYNEMRAAGIRISANYDYSVRQILEGTGTTDTVCPVDIADGLPALTLAEVRRRVLAGRLRSNPYDSIEERWGSVPESGDSDVVNGRRCSQH